jgi:endogenous inhibitor of DNA gyrase (YacG/DUF329 family)
MDHKDISQSKTFPFCSEKCKMADLEGWFTERYRFSSPLKEQKEKSNENSDEKKKENEEKKESS